VDGLRGGHRVWESSLAASAFQAATRSRLIAGQVNRIDRLARMSSDQIQEWQTQRWRRWRRAARLTIPYYRHSAYDDEVLQGLPVLTKDIVRTHGAALRNRLVPARALSTGGTGGQHLLVYSSHTSYFHEWGHIAYAWRSGGISLTDPKITFRGGSLGRGSGESPIIYQRTYNQLLVSPFHLNENIYRNLLKALQDFPARAIFGYPSAVTTFAQWVKRHGPFRELDPVRAVLLGSEPAFDWQLSLLEEVFDARVVRWYGLTEKSVFAFECEYRNGYHALPTYGVTEVVDGRIVGTGFTNRAMPLIRYDTEDEGVLDTRVCRCGLPFPRLQRIATRRDQTFLFGYGDEPISTVSLNFHDQMFSAFSNFQFRQSEAGRISLLLVPGDDGEDVDSVAGRLQQAMQQRVGDSCTIEVKLVGRNELLSKRGKLLVVDQRYQPARR
jgi:phenylacetate-CoA ligase